MGKNILGLDLGTNSIGWALLEDTNKKSSNIIDAGVRIFQKAVEEKTPTPKNQKRREKRLARRVIQRRARRKSRMLNYLVKLDLLPKELHGQTQPEIILNRLGDPYQLRAKALDNPLTKHELGRVLLHLVQRRGFLSSRKTLLGDMVDDPDVQTLLAKLEDSEGTLTDRDKEETAFKKDISALRQTIKDTGYRMLGEYLASLGHHDCKRNRSREGGHLRTDRQMYREELDLIWAKQAEFHNVLSDEVKEQIEDIIFYQRPLKLRSDRIGKCSLEPTRKRARLARLEAQRFRYLQDINNLKYFDYYTDTWKDFTNEDRQKLVELFETKARPTFKTDVRKALGLDKGTEFNLDTDNKKLKGNITAIEIRNVFPAWDVLAPEQQHALVEDLLTISKKSVLKNRLLAHWDLNTETAANLCMLEFEPGHANLSVKAINKLLPYLQQGQIYSDARVSAGYGYEVEEADHADKLGRPPEIPNPIVEKALHEVRRLINAIIAEYGKPDAIRIEMARDLEMNTKRYKAYTRQQAVNTKANDEAIEKYQEMGRKNPHLKLSSYPSRSDKVRYRLWKDQDERCAYSGKQISLATLFSPEIDIDHIIPYSQSLDDSYMNKVVCYTGENRYKGQLTPIDTWGGNEERWNQITQAISRWDKKLVSKKNRFFMKEKDVIKRDFISSQLNDTRYISKITLDYIKQLGTDVSVSKGITTAWLRHIWDLNSLIGESNKKERTDHRHHAIDALVVACVDRQFYKNLIGIAKDLEKSSSEIRMRDLHIDPPWHTLRFDLKAKLQNMIISHATLRKLNGELHKDTGAGFIEGKGTVYRKNLNGSFEIKQTKNIIDSKVQNIIEQHLAKYSNKPKEAFAEGVTVYHKDGKTPIKRVRLFQSTQTKKREKLKTEKFGVKNKDGRIFKWMTYGNIHHMEIIKNNKTNKYVAIFITMMEAHRRAMTGTKSAIRRGVIREPVINKNHTNGWNFVMALHKNDLVSVNIKNRERAFYRVQKLGGGYDITLRLHTETSTTRNKDLIESNKMLENSIENFISKFDIQIHNINILGKI